jgi:Glycogen recognition site of AMP-activated protein kinase
MSGSEFLVQRFVDQELSAEERVLLLELLGRDEDLRQRAVALERLSLEVSRLPRPVVRDGFVAQVLAKTTAPAPSWWSRAAASLWTPHVFEWNLAGAAAAACIALLAVGGVIAGIGSRTAPPVPVTATVAPSRERVLVRLVVVHPGARTVQAAGDFNGWNPTQTPLEQVSNGAWTVTIPLEPGRYEYQFVVDGEQWIADPFAVEQNDDGFGSRNAVLDVRPAGASL